MDFLYDLITLLEDDDSVIGDDEYNNDEYAETETDEYEAEEVIDPNKMGKIRVVKNAHLVYKRIQSDGSFNELWLYNTTKDGRENTIRNNILINTNIELPNNASKDGSEWYEIWTRGDIQFLAIFGLQE